MPAPPEDQPHTSRLPAPAQPTTESDLLSGLEKEKRRTERKIEGTPTDRGLGHGSAVGTGETPCFIEFNVPTASSFIVVSVKFTDAEDGATVMSAGPTDDFSYSVPYLDGGSAPQYVFPVDGATHTTHAAVTGPDGDLAATASAIAFFF